MPKGQITKKKKNASQRTTTVVQKRARTNATPIESGSPIPPIDRNIKHLLQLEGDISRVISEMQKKVGQLEFLAEFSSKLNSSLDTTNVQKISVDAVFKLVECDSADIFQIDYDEQELYCVSGNKPFRLPLSADTIQGKVALTAQGLISAEIAVDRTGRQMLCVPLNVRNKVIGVLFAQRSGAGAEKFTNPELVLLEALGHQIAIALENSQLYESLKKGFYDTVEALTEAIEKKDQYTGGHSKRVAHYAVGIAREMELSDEEIARIRLAAILHDVGKIGVEDKILKKDAPLEVYEWPVMRQHPELGYQIMKKVEGLKEVVDGMRFHHERWDGKGYPQGLRGEEIPLVARIIAIADTYDAIVSTRPYRKGTAPDTAYVEIKKHSGKQFCPRVVDAFCIAFEKGAFGNRSRRSA